MPMDYGMCCQTVTVYRNTPEGVLRQEIPNCYLQWQDAVSFTQQGRRQERKFLLVQPGEEQLIFPCDRVYAGIGPMTVDWNTFVPALVPGLGEVAYATAYHWQGAFCHTEAGRK